jgi:hypothetical protein
MPRRFFVFVLDDFELASVITAKPSTANKSQKKKLHSSRDSNGSDTFVILSDDIENKLEGYFHSPASFLTV